MLGFLVCIYLYEWSRCKDVQSLVGQGYKHGCNHGDFCWTWPTTSTMRISTNCSNSNLVHFVGWLFHTLQTLVNQWPPNYDINIIYSNILPLGSFFQHRPLNTLWGWLPDTITRSSKLLKQIKSIWEKPLCSGHPSKTDTISRFWCCLL